MKKHVALGLFCGLFCLGASALADGLDVASYGKWAEETSATDPATVDNAPAEKTPSEDLADANADQGRDAGSNPAPMTATNEPTTVPMVTAATDQELSASIVPPAPTINSADDANPVAPAAALMTATDAISSATADAPDNTLEAPMGDGYVPIPAPAAGQTTPDLDDRAYGRTSGTSTGTKASGNVSDGSWWKHPDLEFTLLAGGSGSYIPVNERLVDTSGFVAPKHYKFMVSGEGVSSGASIYAGYRRDNTTFGASIGGLLDTHTMKNFDSKRDVNSGVMASSMTFLKRSYTLEFAARIGHYFGDLHLYGKLGGICSAFQYKYRNPGFADAHKSMTAWGGVAGIGLQKPMQLPLLNDAKIGLEYDYHIYQTLTPVIKYSTTVDTSKLRPRYHNGYLTISKTF